MDVHAPWYVHRSSANAPGTHAAKGEQGTGAAWAARSRTHFGRFDDQNVLAKRHTIFRKTGGMLFFPWKQLSVSLRASIPYLFDIFITESVILLL